MKFNPKTDLKVGGKMSERGADTVGKMLATAAIIAAILFGVAAIIAAA